MERLKVSDSKLIRDEENIPGSFSSVTGEYFIDFADKTGFFKVNGCMMNAQYNEDLIELLSSKVLDQIEYPHAEIILATDEKGENGCLSVNILNPNERFIEPTREKPNPDVSCIDDFLNNDLTQIASIPGITSEDLIKRKEFVLRYLLASAVISNPDIKMSNIFIIKDDKTGIFRNPEYYDMGLAFTGNDETKFFNILSATDLIEQLYESYPSQIVPFGKNIQEKLDDEFFDSLSQEECYEELSVKMKNSIIEQLRERTNFIKELNSKEQNNFEYTTDEIHEASKDVPLTLKDNSANFMARLKNKILGRDKDE